ncbi:hypothetical protein M378DRAFT_187418 [Amanita muscaria Koide BX008]|uniref:Cation/H+ exchanger transmembrane domain-containing protein n=1 Tax=Amanita muscaria (strain Koide BX008) TaxID=946122 RepID=A0A0C2WZ24_AMAMK|nr:hypothetical protein M378DRAFT_187418 [Amanita muscaria Koide BX008]
MTTPSFVEATDASLAYICLGGFVVAFSMMSLIAREKLYINEVILGTAFGVLMGPHVANVFNPRSWTQSPLVLDRITLEVTRITLATGLFAIGVELPKSYMYDHAKSLLTMVVPTMAIGWLIVSGLLKALFPKLGLLACLAIASCLTPTDPIISAAIVGGEFATRHVPENLRLLISAESAANDGLAYPFLTFAIYLIVDTTAKDGVKDWVLIGILYQVVMGTVIGALLGYGFSKFMKVAHRMGWIDRQSYVAQYLALSIFTAGLVSTIGSDDLLAAFAAGSAISWDGDFNERTKGELFGTVIDLVLNCGCFIYIGAWIPFETFNMPELGITPWRLSLLCIGILALRRIPALLILYKWIPEIRDWKEALFTGHFGPMGVGAVFVSTLAVHKLPVPTYPPETQEDLLALTLQPIVTFVVLGSIIIHGLSIPFFNMGRNMKTRTLTFARTITTHGTATRFGAPEWLNQISAGFKPPMTNPEVVPAPQPDDRHIQVHVESADDEATSLPGESVYSHNSTGIVDTDIHTGTASGVRLPGGALTGIQELPLPLNSNGSNPSIQTVHRSQVNVASYE